MTDQAHIIVTHPDKEIGLLTLNRPEKRNALDGVMIHEWITVLQKMAKDKKIRVVILAGNGEHFCAGADIAWMQKMAKSTHVENVQDAMQLAILLKTIYTFPKPIIGLVQGAVMGGGLGVIACCDIVLAADNAVFCFSEAKMGLTPSVISPYVIPVIGERAARYYYLTAEKFAVQQALELKLIQQIVTPVKLSATGLTLARTLLQNSPHALIEAKKLIRYIAAEKFSDKLIQFTAEHLADMRVFDDAKEGLNAFLEKRAPVWKSSVSS